MFFDSGCFWAVAGRANPAIANPRTARTTHALRAQTWHDINSPSPNPPPKLAVAGLDCRIANLTMSLFERLSRLTRDDTTTGNNRGVILLRNLAISILHVSRCESGSKQRTPPASKFATVHPAILSARCGKSAGDSGTNTHEI